MISSAYAGITLIGRGDNLSTDSNALVKCGLYDVHKRKVGTETSIDLDNETSEHIFKHRNGSCLRLIVKDNSDFLITRPIDENTSTAFPEITCYLNPSEYADADMLIRAGNHCKNSAGTICWEPSGCCDSVLKGVDRVEVRCAYMVLNGRIIECLGCNYFVDKSSRWCHRPCD